MFGEAKRAQHLWNIEDNSPIYRVKISNQGLRYKNRMSERSEFAIFSNPKVRNQWGFTNTNTRTFSLLKKACEKQASISALRLRSRSGV